MPGWFHRLLLLDRCPAFQLIHESHRVSVKFVRCPSHHSVIRVPPAPVAVPSVFCQGRLASTSLTSSICHACCPSFFSLCGFLECGLMSRLPSIGPLHPPESTRPAFILQSMPPGLIRLGSHSRPDELVLRVSWLTFFSLHKRTVHSLLHKEAYHGHTQQTHSHHPRRRDSWQHLDE